MNQTKPSPSKQKPKSTHSATKSDSLGKILPKILIASSVITVVAIIGITTYNLSHKPKNTEIWKVLDIPLELGATIPHKQTTSIQNTSTDVGVDSSKGDPEDSMFLSVKKIDGRNNVWLISKNNDFGCFPTNVNICTIDIAIDNSPPVPYAYTGGTQHTAYITDSNKLIAAINHGKTLTVNGNFFRRQLTAEEKIDTSFKNGSVLLDTIKKEHIFNIVGLDWQ